MRFPLTRFPFDTFRQEMDRLLQEAPRRPALRSEQFPLLNVWEDQDAYFAEAELPGFQIDELDITVMGNEVSLRGQRAPQSEDGVTYHRRERGVGKFQRVIRLPANVDAEHVEAQLQHGVLMLKLPKTPEAKPRKINVKSS